MELSSSSNLILVSFNCIITILPLPAYRIWNLHIFFCYRLLLLVLIALYMIGYISNKKLDSLVIKTAVKARFSFLALICNKDDGISVWGGLGGKAMIFLKVCTQRDAISTFSIVDNAGQKIPAFWKIDLIWRRGKNDYISKLSLFRNE